MRLKKFLILSISKTYSSSLQSGQISKPSYKQLLSNYPGTKEEFLQSYYVNVLFLGVADVHGAVRRLKELLEKRAKVAHKVPLIMI